MDSISGNGIVNVRDHGVKCDGTTDDAAAIRALFTKTNYRGLYFPGNCALGSALGTPAPGQVLYGTFESANSHAANNLAYSAVIDPTKFLRTPGQDGTTFIKNYSDGNITNAPFLTLGTNNGVKGISFYDASQAKVGQTGTPTANAPTIRMIEGMNAFIKSCEFLNSYFAIDVVGMWRPTITDVVGQPYYIGLQVDKCYDVARLTGIHWETYWDAYNYGGGYFTCPWSASNGYGYIIKRTDLLNAISCFVYGMQFGFVIDSNAGTSADSPWALFMQCNADVCQRAVYINYTQQYGVRFINSTFTGGNPVITANSTFSGDAAFDSCYLLGSNSPVLVHNGTGTVSLTNCTIDDINVSPTAASIQQTAGRLIATGNNWKRAQSQATLSAGIAAALITGNLFKTTQTITNNATAGTYSITNNLAI